MQVASIQSIDKMRRAFHDNMDTFSMLHVSRVIHYFSFPWDVERVVRIPRLSEVWFELLSIDAGVYYMTLPFGDTSAVGCSEFHSVRLKYKGIGPITIHSHFNLFY